MNYTKEHPDHIERGRGSWHRAREILSLPCLESGDGAQEPCWPAHLHELVEILNHLAQFSPMAQYVMERSGEHSIELVSFNLRFASRTWQRTCIPLKKPNHVVPYQRLCQKGQTPCDYQSSMPLQTRIPLGFSLFIPFLYNSPQTLHLLLKFQFLFKSVEIILAAQCWKRGETNDNVICLMKCANFVEIMNFKKCNFLCLM